MTQGRKSRTVLALLCALSAMAAGALLAPVAASAQADQEYNLELPGAGGGNGQAGGDAGGPSATAPDSDGGGGTPIVLIGLAVVAAGCVGVAAWRLRNRDQSRGPKVDQARGPKVGAGTGAAGATSESQ
jgi:hypothetical protein